MSGSTTFTEAHALLPDSTLPEFALQRQSQKCRQHLDKVNQSSICKQRTEDPKSQLMGVGLDNGRSEPIISRCCKKKKKRKNEDLHGLVWKNYKIHE